jgi:hypothetical protein
LCSGGARGRVVREQVWVALELWPLEHVQAAPSWACAAPFTRGLCMHITMPPWPSALNTSFLANLGPAVVAAGATDSTCGDATVGIADCHGVTLCSAHGGERGANLTCTSASPMAPLSGRNCTWPACVSQAVGMSAQQALSVLHTCADGTAVASTRSQQLPQASPYQHVTASDVCSNGTLWYLQGVAWDGTVDAPMWTTGGCGALHACYAAVPANGSFVPRGSPCCAATGEPPARFTSCGDNCFDCTGGC